MSILHTATPPGKFSRDRVMAALRKELDALGFSFLDITASWWPSGALCKGLGFRV